MICIGSREWGVGSRIKFAEGELLFPISYSLFPYFNVPESGAVAMTSFGDASSGVFPSG